MKQSFPIFGFSYINTALHFMTIIDVIKVIDTQFKIQQKVIEIFEQEACEILVLDAILDYWKLNYPNSVVLERYINETEIEQWQIVNRLFIDFATDESDKELEPDVHYLLNYYYQRFYTVR
jgi:hypothetical protein